MGTDPLEKLEKDVLRLKIQIEVLESILTTTFAREGQPLLALEPYRQALADELRKSNLGG